MNSDDTKQTQLAWRVRSQFGESVMRIQKKQMNLKSRPLATWALFGLGKRQISLTLIRSLTSSSRTSPPWHKRLNQYRNYYYHNQNDWKISSIENWIVWKKVSLCGRVKRTIYGKVCSKWIEANTLSALFSRLSFEIITLCRLLTPPPFSKTNMDP